MQGFATQNNNSSSRRSQEPSTTVMARTKEVAALPTLRAEQHSQQTTYRFGRKAIFFRSVTRTESFLFWLMMPSTIT